MPFGGRAAWGADGAGGGSRAPAGAGARAGCERLPPSPSFPLRLRVPSSCSAADRPEPPALYDVSGRWSGQSPRCSRRWGGQRWPEPGVEAAVAVADRKRRGQLGWRRGDSPGPCSACPAPPPPSFPPLLLLSPRPVHAGRWGLSSGSPQPPERVTRGRLAHPRYVLVQLLANPPVPPPAPAAEDEARRRRVPHRRHGRGPR